MHCTLETDSLDMKSNATEDGKYGNFGILHGEKCKQTPLVLKKSLKKELDNFFYPVM